MIGVAGDKEYCEQIKDPETKQECLEILGEEAEEGLVIGFTEQEAKTLFDGVLAGSDMDDGMGGQSGMYCEYTKRRTISSVDGKKCEGEFPLSFYVDIRCYPTHTAAVEAWKSYRDAEYSPGKVKEMEEKREGFLGLPEVTDITVGVRGASSSGEAYSVLDSALARAKSVIDDRMPDKTDGLFKPQFTQRARLRFISSYHTF